MAWKNVRVMVGVAGFGLAASCDFGSGGNFGGGPKGLGPGIGDDCSDDLPCRRGLECVKNKCEATGSTDEGDPCTVTVECKEGLACVDGECTPAGDGQKGDSCQSDADCEPGMRCWIVGLSLQCVEDGDGDAGDECLQSNDCLSPLSCVEGLCTPGVIVPPVHRPDVACAEPSEDGVRAFFEVPGAKGAKEDDFFRLPFPNDVRLVDGKLNLAKFPTPGDDLLGFDPVKRYLDALEETAHGWGAYPTVIFRFSGPVDVDSLRTEGDERRVHFMDITPDTPEYGVLAGLSWGLSSSRTNYVCDNWIGVRRSQGKPLIPGHVYAVWLTTDVVAENGDDIERAENLEAMLADATPSDAKLAQAHEAYAPFRAYLADQSVDPDTVLNASVITVDATRSTMERLAGAVEAARLPTASDWVKCSGGDESPCPQAEEGRACGEGGSGYDEYHALVSLPIFQEGEAPYLEPADGGAIVFTPVRTEKVCMALTVPTTAMPAEGFPLVITSHGTGGSFRSHVRDDVAGALAKAETPSGVSVPFAVLGIDQVEHGPRRGESTDSPQNLFFNFANPAAAQGNPLQGAADQLALLRFAAALDVSAAQTGGAAIKIDPTRIVFFGHSQGGTHGSLMAPYAPAFKAIALSGNGASLMDSLLTKGKPVNISAAVPFALGDSDSKGQLAGGARHPVLTILQHYIDPADPLNFGRAATFDLPASQNPVPIFQPYGLGDTYATPVTQATYAIAAGLGLAEHDGSVDEPDDIGGKEELPVPVSGNATINGIATTLVVREYQPPEGEDGHFVVYDVASAREDLVRFLAMGAAGELPAIGE